MKASHAGLRDDFEVVAPAVDALVTALNNRDDVYGARMTGAGFGGAAERAVLDEKFQILELAEGREHDRNIGPAYGISDLSPC